MTVLLWGFILFLVALAVHVFMWRLRRPRRPLTTLLILFCVVVVIGLAVQLRSSNVLTFFRAPVLPDLPAYVHVAIFYVAMALAYTASYTLIECDSPTISIVVKLMRAGRTGLRRADLIQGAIESGTIESRLQGLLRSKTIVKADGHYRTSSGTFRSMFYRCVLAYGRLLGLERKGG